MARRFTAMLLCLLLLVGSASPVDDECGQQSCTLQMLQHMAGRRVTRSAMKPDPAVLQWAEEPAPGRLVAGTLSVFLDPADEESPELKLEVSMYFAETQPAPKGALLLHCGGPGSSSSCVSFAWGSHMAGYNVWSISQRGIGPAADPALNCNNSHLPTSCPPEGCRVSDFTDCPCALPDGMPQIGEVWADVDPRNQTQIEQLFRFRDAWGSRCASSAKFQLVGKNKKPYNFLEYVGTQFLAYDIERMRLAIGAEKMSFYGYSYGTYVAGVYASVYSKVTGQVVLDGNMDPSPRKRAQATGDSVANDKFVALLLNTCKASQDCPLHSPEEEYAQIVDAARNGTLTAQTKSGKEFPLTVGMLMAYLQSESLSNSGRLFKRALETLAKLSLDKSDPAAIRSTVEFILDGFCFVKGVSTWYTYDVCIGPGNTNEDEEAPGTSFGEPYMQQCAVWGVDQAGYYSVPDLMRQWRSLSASSGDAGVAAAVGDMVGYFLWPARATPNAPMGSSTVKALIIGNLFDPATSYSWAQHMKSVFPEGSLITWQGIGHTFPSRVTDYNREAIAACQVHIKDYLQEGTMPLNGLVCMQNKPPPV